MHRLKAIVLLSKPGIISAETLAGLAGMLLTSATPTPMKSVICGTICILLAACGAALANSLLERGRDGMMPRLAQRCRAIDLLGTFRIAASSVVLISLSLFLAATNLNLLATGLLITAVAAYLLFYTAWLKGSSPWGVFAGAIPGALPPLIGSASVAGYISTPSLLLAAIILVWQFPHFWFLALQYRDEYRKAGIPVLPVSKGEQITKSLILASIALLLPLSLGLWTLGFSSGIYATITIISWVAFFVVGYVDLFRLRLFRNGYIASIAYLLVNVSSIIVDSYLKMNGNLPI